MAADRLNLIRVMPAQGWWPRRPQEKERACPTNHERQFDVRVVGAGVIGLACAWRAGPARAERPRARARSGRAPAPPASPPGCWRRSARRPGGRRRCCGSTLASHAALARTSPRSWRRPRARGRLPALGALHVALDRDEAEELRRRHELMAELGLEARMAARRRVPRARARPEPALRRRPSTPARAASRPGRHWSRAERGRRARRASRFVAGAEVDGAADRGRASPAVRTADGDRAPRRPRSWPPRCVVAARESWLPPRRAPAGAARQGPDPDPARLAAAAALRRASSPPSASTSSRAPTGAWSSAPRSRSAASTRR